MENEENNNNKNESKEDNKSQQNNTPENNNINQKNEINTNTVQTFSLNNNDINQNKEIDDNNEKNNEKEKNEINENNANDIKTIMNEVENNEIKEETKDINTKEENKEEKNEIITKENEYINITEDGGIKKRILKEGQGANPKEGNEVVISYVGKFKDEILVYSKENEPFSFTLGEKKVMKGWEIAVKTMKLGEKSEFIMTPEYTYNDKQVYENALPNSIMTYTIELKSIHYKTTEESLENLTYEEKLQWGRLLKQNGVQKFKENDISSARDYFVKALSFLKTMDPKKEEEKEGVELFLTILSNICNCYNKEKDYESVMKFAFIGIDIKPTPKLLYFRTIASANLEEFEKAENDLNDLILLFASNGQDNNKEVNDTVNYLRELIDSRKKIYEEKNKSFSRAIYRQVFHHNKSKKDRIFVPNTKPNPKNPVVFFEIKIENDIIGKIEFELFKDAVPITVENFRNICIGTEDGLTYKNSNIDKIIKDFVIGGGKLEYLKQEKKCIYGEYFDDENYFYCHCRRGLLTMDNDGKNKNNSKFLITLKHIPWFDGKHVVFGQLINGMEIINQIEEIETDNDGKPSKTITIVNCGEIIKKNNENNIDNKVEENKIEEKNNEGNSIKKEENDIEKKELKEEKQENNNDKNETEINNLTGDKIEENGVKVEDNKLKDKENENIKFNNEEIK